MPDPTLEQLLASLRPEDLSLFRAVRTRVAALGAVSERPEVRLRDGALQGGLAFLRSGAELARLWAKPGAHPRLLVEGEAPLEVAGLKAAAQAAERVQRLAEARAASAPQVDLFGRLPGK